ncbi:MAG: hypothetical protein JNN09_04680 [Alphaproteobacteria bacterium]|nr:hypothetical protein [Alphaproteobacteria bacterium]
MSHEKASPSSPLSLTFTDNPSIKGRERQFITVTVDLAPIVASWRESLFAYEWFTPEGQIRTLAQMSEPVRQKRENVEKNIASNVPLARPVLGIGILDTIEIGAGREVLLTLATHGIETISVHIPESHFEEFRPLIRT